MDDTDELQRVKDQAAAICRDLAALPPAGIGPCAKTRQALRALPADDDEPAEALARLLDLMAARVVAELGEHNQAAQTALLQRLERGEAWIEHQLVVGAGLGCRLQVVDTAGERVELATLTEIDEATAAPITRFVQTCAQTAAAQMTSDGARYLVEALQRQQFKFHVHATPLALRVFLQETAGNIRRVIQVVRVDFQAKH